MMKAGIVRGFLASAAVVLLASPLFGADYKCVPVEVAVLGNRAHVLCAEPNAARNNYPVDMGYSIRYLAVPLSERDWADRFIRLANIAETAGLVMQVSYTSGDYTGESFGCRRQDCRRARSVVLLKTAVIQ